MQTLGSMVSPEVWERAVSAIERKAELDKQRVDERVNFALGMVSFRFWERNLRGKVTDSEGPNHITEGAD